MEMTLYPYYSTARGCWVFDDPATNLKAEEFVLGISEMIDRVVTHKQIPSPRRGFAMTFAADPVPAHDSVLHWQRAECGGNWYAGDVVGTRMEGWLCPALFKYFDSAPPCIFVRCEPLPVGIDPIWDDRIGQGRRFVGPGGLEMQRCL
jgi:hypothetical protein